MNIKSYKKYNQEKDPLKDLIELSEKREKKSLNLFQKRVQKMFLEINTQQF